MQKTLISIVIPTSGKVSDGTLDSVYNSIGVDCEYFVVEGGSLASARIKGIRKSKGEYIMFLDSDQILAPYTLEECLKTCEEGYDAVTLFEESLPSDTVLGKIIEYDKWLFHSLQDDDPIKGSAIPRFFRASLLKKLPLLKNPPLTFEHSIIHNEFVKFGGKVKFIDARIYHNEPRTFRELFKKFMRYGYYYIPALKVDKSLVLHHSLPRRAYFTTKAFRHPVLWLGLIYHYLVKGVATCIGIIRYLFGFKG